ncbi:MAG: proton-conducting transporter membrane subunit [Caulobacterales bacterium]
MTIASILELLRNNAALIAVLAPFIGAPLCALMPAGRWASLLAMLAALIAAIAAGDLALRALSAGAAPIAAMNALGLRLDGVGAFAGALIAGLATLVSIAMPAFIGRRASAPYEAGLFLIALSAWLGLAYAGDLVTLFIAAQISTLALAALGALGASADRAAASGAYRQLIAGAIAGALMLIGAALVARASGGTAFDALAEARVAAPGAASIGYGLMIAAFALLAGVAPLHAWMGGYFSRAASFATLAFAAIGAAAQLAALGRICAYAFASPELGEGVSRALLALGLVSVAFGSIQAIGARDVRRLAAYAGAAQAGCVLIAFAMGSPAGFSAGLVQIFALSAAALALTMAAPVPGAITALDGFARRAPFASIAMTIGALSLMGAPLTIGFLGRWRLIEAGVGGGWWWAAGAVIVASLSAVFYCGRLIERLYFRRASVAQTNPHDPWRIFTIPALLCAAAAVLLGVDPAILLAAADASGRFLTGAAP